MQGPIIEGLKYSEFLEVNEDHWNDVEDWSKLKGRHSNTGLFAVILRLVIERLKPIEDLESAL